MKIGQKALQPLQVLTVQLGLIDSAAVGSTVGAFRLGAELTAIKPVGGALPRALGRDELAARYALHDHSPWVRGFKRAQHGKVPPSGDRGASNAECFVGASISAGRVQAE